MSVGPGMDPSPIVSIEPALAEGDMDLHFTPEQESFRAELRAWIPTLPRSARDSSARSTRKTKGGRG